MTKLDQVLAAIDAVNAADPRQDEGAPEALLYGQRMSAEAEALFPEAPDVLRIAARGQHIERWIKPRAEYPEGRAGYLTWRRDLAAHHADRTGGLMREAGYGAEDIDTVGRMIRKEGIKRDDLVQALEDVICFTFLRWYFAPFAAKHSDDKVRDIVQKTARKMSATARARALEIFEMPAHLAAAFRE
ncbi:MAG: DUF4202 domain-containing protein [Rhodobacteraceae bacterium]|nr:MAG: DUF4202 domain-containing protein [Paracoccaceae bacterium]